MSKPRGTRNLGDNATAELIRASFAEPAIDDDAAHRLLTDCAERAPRRLPADRRFRWVAVVVAAIVLAVGLVTLFALLPAAEHRPDEKADPTPTATRHFEDPRLQAAWAVMNDAGSVLHIIAHREWREYAGDDGNLHTGEVEIWLDPAQCRMRRTRKTLIPGPDAWVARQTEIVSDGIWTILQGEPTTDGSTKWFNVLRYDAALATQTVDPLEVQADLSAYRAALETGTPEYAGTGEVDGTPVYLVRYVAHQADSSTETTMHISTETNLPVRAETSWWWEPNDRPRQLTMEATVTFKVSESVSREDVPPGTFELEIPPGLPVITNVTLPYDAAQALPEARNANMTFYWLGEEWDGQPDPGTVHLTSEATETALFRHMHGGFHADAGYADAIRPLLSTTQAAIGYGPEHGPNVRVVSMPRTDPAAWASAPRAQGGRWIDTESGKAYYVERTGTTRYPAAESPAELVPEPQIPGAAPPSVETESYTLGYLVLDRPDATVILQGFDVDLDRLLEAAGQLRPLE